jgi:lipopolysaccharide export system permease protein
MKILDRYIGTVLALGFVSALAALVAIFSVITFTEELRASHFGVSRALGFVLMTLPSQAYSLFPASALLGTVMGLGNLMRHHELVALQAAGISRLRLAASVLITAVLIAIAGVTLGEMIAAPLSQRAHARRALDESGGRTLSTTAGLWVRDGSRFVNVGEVRADGSLGNVHVFDFDDAHALRRFTRAATATRDGEHWQLADVQKSELRDDGATTRHVPSEEWEAPIEAGRLKALWLQPEDVSAAELHRTIGWLQRHQQNPLRYELAFWRRISAPLYTVIMVMLAVPIVLMSGPRARIGEYVVRGAVIGIGFQMLQQTFTNFGLVAGLPPLMTALAPAGLAAAAMAALYRMQVVE